MDSSKMNEEKKKRGRPPKSSEHARELIKVCHHPYVQRTIRNFDKSISEDWSIDNLYVFIDILNDKRESIDTSQEVKRELDTVIGICKKLIHKLSVDIQE